VTPPCGASASASPDVYDRRGDPLAMLEGPGVEVLRKRLSV
jgi:hypothetical protein